MTLYEASLCHKSQVRRELLQAISETEFQTTMARLLGAQDTSSLTKRYDSLVEQLEELSFFHEKETTEVSQQNQDEKMRAFSTRMGFKIKQVKKNG